MILHLLSPVFTLGSLLGLGRKLDHLFRNAVLANTGLTVEQANVLAVLNGSLGFGASVYGLHDGEGGAAFAELAERLTMTKPGLSRRLKELEGLGWVARQPLSEAALPEEQRPHGNAQRVRITSKGRKQIAPVARRVAKLSSELFQGLTLKQRGALMEAAGRLHERLDQRLQDARADSKEQA